MMKGIEKLKEKLPNYQGKRLSIIIIVVAIMFISSIAFQLIADSLPRIFSSVAILQVIAPLTPIFGSLTIIFIGFILVYSFWRNRDKYLNTYSELAYQKAFKFVITGIPMVITVVIHSFFPTDFIIPYPNNQNLSWYLGTPISDIIFGSSIIVIYIRIGLSIIFVGLGMAVVRKALMIFGIDYMGLVYIYYPEESTLQDHEIYSILRHPTYHTLMLFSIGSIFLRFSVYSLIYFLIFIIGINIHLKYVEEKELIQRFGEHYIKYKQNVPAFLVRFKDLKKYFSIIFRKTNTK
ncbi:MAG: methyltransferase family protein [Promethearchaeota archaeon]